MGVHVLDCVLHPIGIRNGIQDQFKYLWKFNRLGWFDRNICLQVDGKNQINLISTQNHHLSFDINMIKGIQEYVDSYLAVGLLPRYVYKYIRNNDWFINNIKGGTIYYSTPLELNDPFDCQITPKFDGEPKDYDIFFHKIFGDRIEQPMKDKLLHGLINNERGMMDDIKIELRKANNEVGVACFTTVNDNLLMWSHYANGHTGVCLKYDIKKLITDYRYPLKVEYSAEYPEVSYFTSENHVLQATIFGSKSDVWKYEDEYRIISQYAGANETDKESLVEVIFGSRCEDKINIKTLIDANGYKPKYSMAIIKDMSYGLDIVEYV